MELGFTGTRRGMTTSQKMVVVRLLYELKPARVHHGMCIGADKDFDDIALRLKIRRKGWPGVSNDGSCKTRAFCHDIEEQEAERPYKVRDRLIVAHSKVLIATPKGYTEEFRGSGTWLTIRIGRNLGVDRYIVYPDGAVLPEIGTKTVTRI